MEGKVVVPAISHGCGCVYVGGGGRGGTGRAVDTNDWCIVLERL